MPKTGEHYDAPPKRFRVPPDIAALKNYAGMIINQMHGWYTFRMSGKPEQKKGGKKK